MKRIVTSKAEMFAAIVDLAACEYPVTVTIAKGEPKRSDAMNRTVHLWFGEIATHRGDTSPAEVKAECNLKYGVPIKRRDDEEWASAFGYIFDSLNYPSKLKALRVLDIPVTRNMTVKQLGEYLDQMQRDFIGEGIRLTDPELRKYEEGKAA